MTGMVTDVGIELGHFFYALLSGEPVSTLVEWSKARLLASLIGLFFFGGIVGALGFRHLGFLFSLPLAALLILLASMPIIDDLRSAR
jgi:hypothetical protein